MVKAWVYSRKGLVLACRDEETLQAVLQEWDAHVVSVRTGILVERFCQEMREKMRLR